MKAALTRFVTQCLAVVMLIGVCAGSRTAYADSTGALSVASLSVESLSASMRPNHG